MNINYTKINIKTLLLDYLKYKNTRSWIIDITSIVLLFLTYYFSPFITIFPFILILLFTLIMIYVGTIEPLYDTWKRWNETYYNNFQIKMERKNILRTSGKNPKHIYEIIHYHKNGDVKSHKRFGDGEPEIMYLDPLYKNTQEKKEKRKLEKSKKEDTIEENNTDIKYHTSNEFLKKETEWERKLNSEEFEYTTLDDTKQELLKQVVLHLKEEQKKGIISEKEVNEKIKEVIKNFSKS